MGQGTQSFYRLRPWFLRTTKYYKLGPFSGRPHLRVVFPVSTSYLEYLPPRLCSHGISSAPIMKDRTTLSPFCISLLIFGFGDIHIAFRFFLQNSFAKKFPYGSSIREPLGTATHNSRSCPKIDKWLNSMSPLDQYVTRVLFATRIWNCPCGRIMGGVILIDLSKHGPWNECWPHQEKAHTQLYPVLVIAFLARVFQLTLTLH